MKYSHFTTVYKDAFLTKYNTIHNMDVHDIFFLSILFPESLSACFHSLHFMYSFIMPLTFLFYHWYVSLNLLYISYLKLICASFLIYSTLNLLYTSEHIKSTKNILTNHQPKSTLSIPQNNSHPTFTSTSLRPSSKYFVHCLLRVREKYFSYFAQTPWRSFL